MSALLERAKQSGHVPPSSTTLDVYLNVDQFDADLLQQMDPSEFRLREGATEFGTILEKSSSVEKILEQAPAEIKQKAIIYRRSVILAVVAQTPSESPSLDCLLSDGFLTHVKSWLDEILAAPDGKLDFVLLLLSSIAHLPVTKSVVKGSGMNKAINTIEKHKICKGTPNEASILKRVKVIKDRWNASVKARKAKDVVANGSKRPVEHSVTASSAKKVKTESSNGTEKKQSSLSSLLKKVSDPKQQESKDTKRDTNLASAASSTTNVTKPVSSEDKSSSGSSSQAIPKNRKKASKRVKWSDHFGGDLAVAKVVEGSETAATDQKPMESVSWSDRRKRDRIREKELLAKANMMNPTVAWQIPKPLPSRSEITPPQVESFERSLQADRIQKVARLRYQGDSDVPNNPTPLSDVEEAHDMRSQQSAVVATIPFFASQQGAPTPDAGVAAFAQVPQPAVAVPLASASVLQPGVASLEFVQALGLPTFLVGQQVQALQMLANSPGLLRTMIDANGMYDQVRLMSLVATLSTPGGNQASQPAATTSYQQPNTGSFGSTPSYGHPPGPSGNPGFPSRNSSDDGNLHVVGFGPSTTEADIIAAFSPFVRIDEVVMKGTFAFVNTSDPPAAARAKEALAGVIIGGMPIRINPATRKSKDNIPPIGLGKLPSTTPAQFGLPAQVGAPAQFGSSAQVGAPAQVGTVSGNVDHVRDDRGNPATKNLFVAGFGHSTTELQLRELFSQYALVTGVVNKGSFAFVNTTDRVAAVRAREALLGTMVNGGVLRINFAKETGRLGTSFDLTYNANTGPNSRKPVSAAPPNLSYYGRGY